MDRWIATTNLKEFRRQLADEKDPEKRRILAELIAKEEQKLGKEEAE